MFAYSTPLHGPLLSIVTVAEEAAFKTRLSRPAYAETHLCRRRREYERTAPGTSTQITQRPHHSRSHLNTPTQELKLLLQINFEAIKLFFGFKHFLVL